MVLLRNALETAVLRLVSPCDNLPCVEALLGVFRKQDLGKTVTEYRIFGGGGEKIVFKGYMYLKQTSQDILSTRKIVNFCEMKLIM